ncbi:hypothetical protein DY000_02046998 [Brassica cretica]|uniref:Uncharacterized protein n=1 Tax=Brassica cretica TaxID=69181 RepID=A0ABQ7F225_BRACR|nr:hypothetical protein DY000_02046998 [Brassica cretica]
MSFGGSHWCRPTSDFGHRSTDFNQNRSTSFPEHRSTTPSELVASCNTVRIMTHEEFAARHPHPPSPLPITSIDKLSQPSIDKGRPPPIDNLQPQLKPSVNPRETISTHSEDAPEPMEVDKAPMGRTLRKRKEKVDKHLKRVANEKAMESFLKRVLRTPLEKPFEEAYFTHRMWMFLRDTKETEDDIRRMFHQVREKMKNWITLKKKSDPEKFAIPCLVKTCHCGAEYETEYSTSIKTHTPTSIDSANQKSIDSHLEESIDSSSTATRDDWPPHCYPSFALKDATSSKHLDEYDEDYEEERATEYRGIRDEEDMLLYHSYGIRNATSIDRGIRTSIDTHHHHTNHRRASTDIAYYISIDNGVDHATKGDYSIGSWEDDHYHESYAAETVIHEPTSDELHEGFTTEELLNHQERSDTDSLFAEACGRGTHFYRPFSRAKRPSIDNKGSTSIDNRPKPTSTGSRRLCKRNGWTCTAKPQRRVTNESYNTAGGVDGHFKPQYQQHTRLSINRRVPPSIDSRPEFGKVPCDCNGIRRFHWEQKDEYGVYRDVHGHARGVNGDIIHVSKDDIRNILERVSMDEHSYICLPEHTTSFTHTKLVPEIYYAKDEINEMFYGICGA